MFSRRYFYILIVLVLLAAQRFYYSLLTKDNSINMVKKLDNISPGIKQHLDEKAVDVKRVLSVEMDRHVDKKAHYSALYIWKNVSMKPYKNPTNDEIQGNLGAFEAWFTEDNTYESMLEKYADDDGAIMLTLLEYGYLDMALNFYLTSLSRLQIHNYLFIAPDNKTCDILHRREIHCFHFANNDVIDIGSSSNFGSKGFNVKTHFRVNFVLEALRMNFSVLLFDLDIVFIKNPLPLIKKTAVGYDLVVQNNDAGLVCMGFYYVKPTRQSIDIFGKAWEIGRGPLGETQNDQEVMIELVTRNKGFLNVKLLEEKLYPNGLYYWETGRRMFQYFDPWSSNKEIIIHNNWIVSTAAKIYRFRESQLWMLDEGYYSNSSTKYLTYHNPYDGDPNLVKSREKNALLNALAIGYILNRKVILPTFHCYGCNSGACKTQDEKCSLLAIYDINKLDRNFHNEFREHVFLHNKLTPDKVKQSKTETFVISSDLDLEIATNSTQQPKPKFFKPKNQTSGASVWEIKEWFGDITESVLVFASLYDAFKGFPDEKQFAEIRPRLENALSECGYRQLRCKI